MEKSIVFINRAVGNGPAEIVFHSGALHLLQTLRVGIKTANRFFHGFKISVDIVF